MACSNKLINENLKYYFSTLQFMFQTLGFFLVSNLAVYFLPSLESEVSEDDDEEDDAVEAPCQHPVEEGKERFRNKW